MCLFWGLIFSRNFASHSPKLHIRRKKFDSGTENDDMQTRSRDFRFIFVRFTEQWVKRGSSSLVDIYIYEIIIIYYLLLFIIYIYMKFIKNLSKTVFMEIWTRLKNVDYFTFIIKDFLETEFIILSVQFPRDISVISIFEFTSHYFFQ